MSAGNESPAAGSAPVVERVFTQARPLAPAAVTYTISVRRKPCHASVFGYLRFHFGNVPLREIDSVFGFVEQSELYGGRPFRERELSDRDVMDLNNAGIGVRLPLSNHTVERDEYERNLPMLAKYHRPGNFAIVTNDNLARWLRQDFPEYHVDASVIKNLKTHRKIDEALELYDSAVLPMRLNEDLEFLEKVTQKDRIVLFANAGCALTCPSKLCYPSISRFNKGTGDEIECSQPIKERDMLGMVDFPLKPYIDLGFHRFKLLRAQPDGLSGF